ncbi:hypothetical protein ACFOW1_03595 [Parasediminibacterium paludis]|uniref:Uncharacterized protein n=1 Tax=Parasediminibacterium paludis TaxID=908966 RepID=A0ABV8PTN9_9BACT
MAKKIFKLINAATKITELRDFQKFKFENLKEGSEQWKIEYQLFLEYDLLVNVINDHNDGSKTL